jgi:hypothetical protein
MNALHTIAEKNARVSARGEYARWLARRFGDLDLLLTKEGEDRVHLRDIYVPLRLDSEDRGDESMGDASGLKAEKPPRRDARELIAELPLVAISGRPGSGKTTLVQAIVGELVSERPSEFRRSLVGQRGILPIPLILRDYQNELPSVRDLDELLGHWWRQANREALDKGFRLDVERLRQSYAPDGDRLPLFLLFDGIDEVGGLEPRRKLLDLALRAAESGHRVVLTGRPTGFQDLPIGSMQWIEPDGASMETGAVGQPTIDDQASHEPSEVAGESPASPLGEAGKDLGALLRDLNFRSSQVQDPVTFSDTVEATVTRKLRLYHVQPFAWSKIRAFIERFFLIRDEWRTERERFLTDFETALSDPQRGYLLTLARRPIFLTLMALVHANDRRMPHGRADLYRRIIDLYLVRQNQQRRLRWSHLGGEMPHWDEREVRRALGYLAWRSQHRGAEAKESEEKRDRRQVVWTRAELLAELAALLDPAKATGGGFREIRPEDAETLLGYFLHPTGLLIEPAEDRFQFAHLSFQEYLCAEYIHGRALALGSRRFLDGIRTLLYENLGLPGWDEVGLLLLCIHAGQGAQTERTAHLELLTELNPAERHQGRLLVAALTGQELDFTEAERRRWLPLAAATALVHPDDSLAAGFSRVTTWSGPGLELLRGLFAATDPFAWLEARSREDLPGDLSEQDWSERGWHGGILARWNQPPNDASWSALFGPVEARAYALLRLTNHSAWTSVTSGQWAERLPMAPELESALTGWLEKATADEPGLLYPRGLIDEAPTLPSVTIASFELDQIVPTSGPLWSALLARVPLDVWLLQGGAPLFFFDPSSQPTLLLGLYPRERPPTVTRLALALFQALRIGEAQAKRTGFAEFARSRSRSRSVWLSSSLSGSLSRSLSLSLSRSRSLQLFLFLSHLQLQSQSQSQSQLQLQSQLQSQSLSLLELESLSEPLRVLLKHTVNRIASLGKGQVEMVGAALETFGYRVAALDWFDEQANDPDLMSRRGLRPGEPLPRDLGLFDDSGRIQDPLPRAAVVRLRAWLEDDDRILQWVFPEGLSAVDEQNLREQLQILHHAEHPDGTRGQPWSPIAAIDAVLADWPEDQPNREVSLAAAERDLMAVLKPLLTDADAVSDRDGSDVR